MKKVVCDSRISEIKRGFTDKTCTKNGKVNEEKMAKYKETDWEESSGNVFADLELNQPEELLARSKLLHRVSTLIKNSKLSQKEVAKKLGITQPKVSILTRK